MPFRGEIGVNENIWMVILVAISYTFNILIKTYFSLFLSAVKEWSNYDICFQSGDKIICKWLTGQVLHVSCEREHVLGILELYLVKSNWMTEPFPWSLVLSVELG